MSFDSNDRASAQLQADLRHTVTNAHISRRPILTHLNADTTWVLSIPYPSHIGRPAGRCRYNILIDPWFKGPQTDYVRWFSTQWHAVKSIVNDISELDVLLEEAEQLELDALEYRDEDRDTAVPRSYVDLVVVSHEFTDHCHRQTLLEVDPRVPVITTGRAAKLISSWSHFETVVDMKIFNEKCDWRTTSVPPLPSWLGISRLVTASDAMYFHSAVIICLQQQTSMCAEAVIYTPHGLHAATFSTLGSASPPLKTLAFLHGLHDVSIAFTKQLNLGGLNAIKAQKMLQPKYWVSTHDEVKKSGGIIAPFLRRKVYTFGEALGIEFKNLKEATVDSQPKPSEVKYVDLGSGESLLLE